MATNVRPCDDERFTLLDEQAAKNEGREDEECVSIDAVDRIVSADQVPGDHQRNDGYEQGALDAARGRESDNGQQQEQPHAGDTDEMWSSRGQICREIIAGWPA